MTRPVQLVTGLFLASVVGAWAWFNVAPPASGERMTLHVNHEIPGWQFTSEPIGSGAQEILATTNLFNGTFTSPRGDRVIVFSADWRAADARSMSVVQHTPDICWVGAGWTAAQVGQPPRVDIRLGDRTIPFECRAFIPPGGAGRQLVLWCTLVGGQVLAESDRWTLADEGTADARSRATASSRRAGANQFLQNVADRRSGIGEKQFVRFSVALPGGDWPEALRRLAAFATEWIRAVVDRPEA